MSIRKSISIASLLTIAAVSTLNAQAMTVGVRGGLSSADLRNDIFNFQARSGFSAGAFFGLEFADGFWVMPELMYTQKGTDSQLRVPVGIDPDSIIVESLQFKARISYIELQIPLVYSAAIGSQSLRPRLYAGPAFSYEVECTTDQTIQDTPISAGCEDTIDGSQGPRPAFTMTRKLDIGIVFGAGFNVAAGKGDFTFDARFNYGLTNINEDGGGNRAVFNRTLQLLAGYAFDI